MDASRYFEELTKSLVTAKNQLHRNLQSTFPQIESIMANPTGKVYWTIVSLFPHAQYVLDSDETKIYQELLSITRVGKQRARYLTTRLYSLANQSNSKKYR